MKMRLSPEVKKKILPREFVVIIVIARFGKRVDCNDTFSV